MKGQFLRQNNHQKPLAVRLRTFANSRLPIVFIAISFLPTSSNKDTTYGMWFLGWVVLSQMWFLSEKPLHGWLLLIFLYSIVNKAKLFGAC